jgi:hypothetical protein
MKYGKNLKTAHEYNHKYVDFHHEGCNYISNLLCFSNVIKKLHCMSLTNINSEWGKQEKLKETQSTALRCK